MRKILVATVYVVLFAAGAVFYVRYPSQREHLKFWIPQSLLMLTVIVTSLYVMLTSELVEETRRLQNRPLLEISFVETESEGAGRPRFTQLIDHGLGIYQGVARMIGGEQITVPVRSLVLVLKNIGSATARKIVVEIKLVSPGGPFSERLDVQGEVCRDATLSLQVVPAPLPYTTIEVINLSYGDGLKTYQESVGERRFTWASS